MTDNRLLNGHVFLEDDRSRGLALEAMASAIEPVAGVALWRAAVLIPTVTERSRLAFSLRMRSSPGAHWALISHFLYDAEQDVVGNAVNALSFSRNRSLGHRVLRFYERQERPQRILYCAARYAEEAQDCRLASSIGSTIMSDLSDAFLSRAFNALRRHGVRDQQAKDVARELIRQHQAAVNLDRKAAIAAVTYLCFAGGVEDLAELERALDGIAIAELRCVIRWGLAEVERTSPNRGFTVRDAFRLFELALEQVEPVYAGYGGFSDDTLVAGVDEFLGQIEPRASNLAGTVKAVLGLGHAPSVDALANHPVWGLAAALERNVPEELGQWRTYAPFYCDLFMQSLRDAKNFSRWHEGDFELLFCALSESEIVRVGKSTTSKAWGDLFEALLTRDIHAAAGILAAEFLAWERCLGTHGESLQIASGRSKKIQDKLLQQAAMLARTCAAGSADERQMAIDLVYGVVVGCAPLVEVVPELLDVLFPAIDSWVFPGIAGFHHLSQTAAIRVATHILHTIHLPNPSVQLSLDEYLFSVCTNLSSLLSLLFSGGLRVPAEVLERVREQGLAIQAFLEAVHQAEAESSVTSGEGGGGSDEEEGADWSGHVAVDRPVVRWITLCQVLLSESVTAEIAAASERLLVEALRVAPHVEKRWVVRALVRLGSDDAIKALLYQAIQHVDAEFASLTIRELLPSHHPRAQQALIRCVGRSSVADDLKQMILDDLPIDNPESILHELRALELMKLPSGVEDAVRDAVGRVGAHVEILPQQDEAAHLQSLARVVEIDAEIKARLPRAERLSVDTLSALRTAEMILSQSQFWGTEAVDLSPIVNMHTKAVELAMRETFEPFTNSLLRKGVLSRKLDVIGYARPIPEKMQAFEDYLGALPIIKTIPYFSKFKLRKILRAICMFRPGKRFTLDGPKAFALFFLVTARKECPFGLANLLDIGFASDNDTFEFIRMVHSLQDSRNRAVHEGLTWEAHDDIQAMREQAFVIIGKAVACGEALGMTSVTEMLEAR